MYITKVHAIKWPPNREHSSNVAQGFNKKDLKHQC